jgi:hypothetical protein
MLIVGIVAVVAVVTFGWLKMGRVRSFRQR